MKKIVLIGLMVATPAAAEVGESTTVKRSFEVCLETIRQMSAAMGEAPSNIVETSTLRVVRMDAADGSVLVTCNGAQGTMTMTPSSRKCGVDVNC